MSTRDFPPLTDPELDELWGWYDEIMSGDSRRPYAVRRLVDEVRRLRDEAQTRGHDRGCMWYEANCGCPIGDDDPRKYGPGPF